MRPVRHNKGLVVLSMSGSAYPMNLMVLWGLGRGFMGIMEKKMETTRDYVEIIEGI